MRSARDLERRIVEAYRLHLSESEQSLWSLLPVKPERIHRTYIFLVRRVSHPLIIRHGGQIPYP